MKTNKDDMSTILNIFDNYFHAGIQLQATNMVDEVQSSNGMHCEIK